MDGAAGANAAYRIEDLTLLYTAKYDILHQEYRWWERTEKYGLFIALKIL